MVINKKCVKRNYGIKYPYCMVEGLKPFTNRIIDVVIKYRQISHTRNPNLGIFTRCSNTTMKANNGLTTMQTTLNNVKAAGAAPLRQSCRHAAQSLAVSTGRRGSVFV